MLKSSLKIFQKCVFCAPQNNNSKGASKYFRVNYSLNISAKINNDSLTDICNTCCIYYHVTATYSIKQLE